MLYNNYVFNENSVYDILRATVDITKLNEVAEFLDSLDSKMAAKLIGLMELLEENGTTLRKPYSEHLEDGIFELRCKQGSNITRVLYFFYVGKKIIATNGFVKKSQNTPPNEIKLAKKRRADWLQRQTKEA